MIGKKKHLVLLKNIFCRPLMRFSSFHVFEAIDCNVAENTFILHCILNIAKIYTSNI
jgi:hypothetical protein